MNVLRRILRAIQSYFAALKASAALGRASRLHRHGKLAEAMIAARDGLSVLGKTYVLRNRAPEGAALTTLTLLVEELALETHEPGASRNDLRDTLVFLKRLNENPSPEVADQLAWMPYLESRLEKGS